jgi:predicted GH43/DUF377 family glycosyl hydrolase
LRNKTHEKGKLKILMSPREGYFDSQLTECGPPAVLTENGIVLIYNGKNLQEGGDENYTANTYCAGQALFDKEEALQIKDRLDKPFWYQQPILKRADNIQQVRYSPKGWCILRIHGIYIMVVPIPG